MEHGGGGRQADQTQAPEPLACSCACAVRTQRSVHVVQLVVFYFFGSFPGHFSRHGGAEAADIKLSRIRARVPHLYASAACLSPLPQPARRVIVR